MIFKTLFIHLILIPTFLTSAEVPILKQHDFKSKNTNRIFNVSIVSEYNDILALRVECENMDNTDYDIWVGGAPLKDKKRIAQFGLIPDQIKKGLYSNNDAPVVIITYSGKEVQTDEIIITMSRKGERRGEHSFPYTKNWIGTNKEIRKKNYLELKKLQHRYKNKVLFTEKTNHPKQFQYQSYSHLAVGKIAPELIVTNWANSSPLLLQNLLGKIIVLDLWATWCDPCIKAMPELNKLYNHYKNNNVVFIGICSSNGAENFNQIIDQNMVAYPNAVDRRGQTHHLYFLESLTYPTYHIIDHNGRFKVIACPLDKLNSEIQKLI